MTEGENLPCRVSGCEIQRVKPRKNAIKCVRVSGSEMCEWKRVSACEIQLVRGSRSEINRAGASYSEWE